MPNLSSVTGPARVLPQDGGTAAPVASSSQNAAGQYNYNGDSANAAGATGFYGTLAQAMAAYKGAGAGQQPVPLGGQPSNNTLDSYYGNLGAYQPATFESVGQIPYIQGESFNAAQIQGPQGNPQAASVGDPGAQGSQGFSAAQVQGAPGTPQAANVQDQGGLGYANVNTPGGPGAAQVNPANFQSYLNQFMGTTERSLRPEFDQQNDQLNSDLNARGLNNSSAASYEMGNLYGRQDQALAQAESPLIQAGLGAANQGAFENAGMLQQSGLAGYQGALQSAFANQGAQNNALSQTFGARNQNALSNAGFEQQANLTGYDAQQQNARQNAQYQQQASEFGAQAANTANQYNANSYQQIKSGDVNNYNNYLSSLFNNNNALGGSAFQALMGTYGDPTAVNSISGAGNGIASGAGNAYNNAVNNQFTQQQNSYNGFMGTLGSVIGAGAKFA